MLGGVVSCQWGPIVEQWEAGLSAPRRRSFLSGLIARAFHGAGRRTVITFRGLLLAEASRI
jgi:hypothetical protein